MGANNYVFQRGMSNVYLAKKINNSKTMSMDRRIVDNNEIIALFEFYLENFCIENKSSCLEIKDNKGNILFEARPKGLMLENIKKEIKLK